MPKKEHQRQRNKIQDDNNGTSTSAAAPTPTSSPSNRLWGLSGIRKSQSDGTGNLFQLHQQGQHHQQQQHQMQQQQQQSQSFTHRGSPPHEMVIHEDYPASSIPNPPQSIPFESSSSNSKSDSPVGYNQGQGRSTPAMATTRLASSPGTPPKKIWERQYRNFLQRGGNVNKQVQQQPPPPPSTLPIPPISTGDPDAAGAAGGGSEGSVRGGNFFSNVFSRGHHHPHNAYANNANANANHTHDGASSGDATPPTHRRRVKSFSHTDELDETKRRGSKKSSLKRVTSEESASTLPAAHRAAQLLKAANSHTNSPAAAAANRQRASTCNDVVASEAAFMPQHKQEATLAAAVAVAAAEVEEQEDYISTPMSSPAGPLSRGKNKSQDPLDTRNDSMDLSRSSSAMKKAFTEFHNSATTGQDSGQAYLGDDPSHKGHNLYWAPNQRLAATVFGPPPPTSSLQQQQNQQLPGPGPHYAHTRSASVSATSSRLGLGGSVSHNNLNNLKGHFSISPSLETVQESVAIKSARILKPILGVDTWSNGRRYLIAPAALAACPLTVLTTLSGSADDVLTAQQGAERKSAFGTIVLGEAVLSYVGVSHKSQTVQRWSSACLVLRQNYLLEYDNLSAVRGLPRGFCHLQYAVCHNHQDFSDALELHFYASPCARADKRVLMIRVQQREQREYWKKCLNRAAGLEVKDLFVYDAHIPLGIGQYASVHPARRKEPSEQQQQNGTSKQPYNCALKIFDKKQFWRLVVKGQERADTLVRETSVQATLTAKCGRVASFLKLRGFFETCDQIILELELLEGTDLFKYISSKGVLSEQEAGRILIDILKSLEAMKRIGLAHRDIKPANVLMCHTGRQGPAAKVGDFGMSTFVDVDGQVRGRCGTPGYVAPEIFTAGIHGGYGNKVDVFSAGVTLYVMLCGYEPFYGETDAELVAANKAARVEFTEADWAGISTEARDMVTKMMHPDPAQRLDAKAALAHPWLRRLDKDSDALDRSLSLPSHEAPTDDACVIS
jgi:serine/threonine protein kinase